MPMSILVRKPVPHRLIVNYASSFNYCLVVKFVWGKWRCRAVNLGIGPSGFDLNFNFGNALALIFFGEVKLHDRVEK